MATNTPKPVHSLVLDTGPLIKNDPSVSSLIAQAEVLYTIPAVIEEIRDVATRSRLETTLKPFLTLRSPTAASIKIITDFARKTGDLAVLSRPDIHVIALAYELECERNHGDWRLRSVPGQKRLNGAPPSSSVPTVEDTEATEPEVITENEVSVIDQQGGTPVVSEPATLEATIKNIHLSSPETYEVLEPAPESIAPTPAIDEAQIPSDISAEEVQGSEAEDSDGGEWITPSNLKKHQEKDSNTSLDPEEKTKTMQVATITSDYAMQNVLLRMNLNLLSPKFMRVRELKTWVLRCHACFYISKDMAKQFCPRCGKPSLMRTSCSTDKDGNFKVHLKKNMQYNTRGNVYSIPKPVAGTSNGKLVSGGGKGGWGQGLILAEDQKEYVQAMTGARRKKEKDLMDEDYLPSILSGARGGVGGKPKVGAGKNVNSKKR
ncbi:putative 20S-pre-rRNA D-site endonuclease nob1 [Mollisia scopiformis]|uniref:20S-pre-rRNA D-site endonuclease NOB1 n=1 Tax=Mollisia scopiformis TaxID=149040 RepID=A0A194XBL9_MOLSC|nr:putative 20S-pre-rRNA D-site endonuclease nob1 [Mollisia scopiformis]KUJ17559.1 putative 20S-pre-rRNA D-site endonuclease nob1 [Mollisia scopiformis]